MSTWADLSALRAAGQKPRLPVIVTTNRYLERNLRGVGALVIEHDAGAPMPVQALLGLEVILMLPNCMQGLAVKQLMDARGVCCARLRAWCRCEKQLTVVPQACSEARP